jgi:hypothetical protein
MTLVSAEADDAMARFAQAIAADILSSPDLRDAEWDTCTLLAEVGDDVVTTTAYRYTEGEPPVPIDSPEDEDENLWALRDATRGVDGQAWDIVLVKIRRETAQLVMNFVSGDAVEIWRITPENAAHVAEALRPRPEDFQE